MRKLLFLLTFQITLATSGVCQNSNFKVNISMDPRVELLSIVSHLAGYDEYNQCKIPEYKKEAEEYFSKFSDHPAVQFARKLKRNNSVGYDAPMVFAVHLTDSVTPLIPFNPFPPNMDRRFRIEDLEEYVELLSSFSKETGFASYYQEASLKYKYLVDRYTKLVNSIVNFSWFQDFLGVNELKNYNIIISLGNGQHNYGPSINYNGEEKMFSILGAAPIPPLPEIIPKTQDKGLTIFAGIIVHEIGHSFMNKVILNNTDKTEITGKRLLNIYKSGNPQRQYSGWTTVLCESMVRSLVLCYMKENQDTSAVEQIIKFDAQQGFYWTEGMARILMESHKSKTVEEMLPAILTFLDEYCRMKENT